MREDFEFQNVSNNPCNKYNRVLYETCSVTYKHLGQMECNGTLSIRVSFENVFDVKCKSGMKY